MLVFLLREQIVRLVKLNRFSTDSLMFALITKNGSIKYQKTNFMIRNVDFLPTAGESTVKI